MLLNMVKRGKAEFNLAVSDVTLLTKAGQPDQDMNLLKGCPGMEYVFNSDRVFYQSPKASKWSAVPLPCHYLLVISIEAGQRPGRGRSPVEWGEIPSVQMSVCTFV